MIGTTRSLNEPYAPSLLVVGCVVCKGRKTMSSMKDAYLKLLRPMDGQQADTPEPKTETKPVVITTHRNQQPLFAGVAK